jgi:mRNA interferase HigB
MRLSTRRTLETFASEHADVRQALADLCAMFEAAQWRDADHLRSTSIFPARPIGDRRIIFNIKGNDYRVIVSVRYADMSRGLHGIVRVHFVGTHADYDRIDAATVDIPTTLR